MSSRRAIRPTTTCPPTTSWEAASPGPARRPSASGRKGTAHYFDVTVGEAVAPASAWGYDHPSPAFAAIAGFVAFYPACMDRCLLGDEEVEPQPGGFYGGWITANLIGPFKGGPGTQGW